jgi:hypothetical protein
MNKLPEPEAQARARKGDRASDSGQADGGWTGGACAKDVSEATGEGATGACFNGGETIKGASVAYVAVQQ